MRVAPEDRALIHAARDRLAEGLFAVQQASDTKTLRRALAELRIAATEADKLAFDVEERTKRADPRYHVLEGA
jgi:hypothetical protein